MNERFEWKSFVGRNLSRKEMLTPAKIGVDNTKCIYVPQPPHLSQKKLLWIIYEYCGEIRCGSSGVW